MHRDERRAERDTDVELLAQRLRRLGAPVQEAESLLEEPDRLPVGRAGHRFVPGLAKVRHRLVHGLTLDSMLGQQLDVLDESIGVQPLHRLDDGGVDQHPAILQEAAVRHLVGQGVGKPVLELGEESRLVEELGGLEPG
jgi:hypothetical protein